MSLKQPLYLGLVWVQYKLTPQSRQRPSKLNPNKEAKYTILLSKFDLA